MDPVTLIGLLASVVQIGNVVHKSIKKLSDLKRAYRGLPLVVSTLIGQLYIIQTAIDRLSLVCNSSELTRHPRYLQLAIQMNRALESFGPLMLALQERLNNMNTEPGPLSMRKKALFLWHERDMDMFLTLIDRQVNALNLLLQAIQCSTWTKQQTLFDNVENQNALQLAQDCSSSIYGISDCESIVTENTDCMSAEFEFDSLIIGSRPYLSAARAHLRSAVRSTRPITETDTSIHAVVETTYSESFDVHLAQGRRIEQVETPTTHSSRPSTIREDDSQSMEPLDAVDLEQPTQPSSAGVDRRYCLQKDFTIFTTLPRRMNGVASKNGEDSNSMFPGTFVEKIKSLTRVTVLPAPETPDVKITLLGTSESGKTTLLKGLKLMMEGDYTRKDRRSFREIIFDNLVLSVRAVLESMERFDISVDNTETEPHVTTIFTQPACMNWDCLPADVASAIEVLWADSGFRYAYERRREYQLNDSMEYYAQSIGRIKRADYLPSSEDIIRAQVRTTGMREITFSIPGICQRVCDLGGTRSQRGKWFHGFRNADFVYYLVDATAYDRWLCEDQTVNRMQEQLVAFDNIVNSYWLVKTNFMLIFTKVDLVEERIRMSHPAQYFEDFKPGVEERSPTVDEYLTYLEQQFLRLIQSEEHWVSIQVVRVNLVDIDAWYLARNEIRRL